MKRKQISDRRGRENSVDLREDFWNNEKILFVSCAQYNFPNLNLIKYT